MLNFMGMYVKVKHGILQFVGFMKWTFSDGWPNLFGGSAVQKSERPRLSFCVFTIGITVDVQKSGVYQLRWGSSSHYLQGFSTMPGGPGFLPSTVVASNWCIFFLTFETNRTRWIPMPFSHHHEPPQSNGGPRCPRCPTHQTNSHCLCFAAHKR